MGYTHYYNQTRDFTAAEWSEVCEEVGALLGYIQHKCEIQIGDANGDRGTKALIDSGVIMFNGMGDDSHETFVIERKRVKDDYDGRKGANFCKTARKPYDLAVVAVLCYLSTVREAATVTSDGNGANFVQGLEAARQGLPRYANVLDIPLGVMKADRWCGPWTDVKTPSYSFDFCVDGFAYITRTKTGETYRFPDHKTAAEWALRHQEPMNRRYHYSDRDRSLFKPMGSFDQKRHANIGRQQARVLRDMIEIHGPLFAPERMGHKPPAYVRPGSLPLMAEDAPRAYWLTDLIKEAEAV